VGTLSRRHFGAAETFDRTSPSSSKGIFLCLIGGDVLGFMRIAGFAGPPVLGSAMNVTVSYISFCSFFLLALGEFNGTGLKRSTVFLARFLTILEDVLEPYRDAKRIPTCISLFNVLLVGWYLDVMAFSMTERTHASVSLDFPPDFLIWWGSGKVCAGGVHFVL
jgi:hypothetical protein